MATVIKSIRASGGDYSTVAAWESDLDNDTPYDAGDDAIGEMYAEAYNETVTINGGGTLGLASVTLRANAAERHDGTPGSGPRFVSTANPFIGINGSTIPFYIEFIEYNHNDGSDSEILTANTGSVVRFRNLIVHNSATDSTSFNCYGIRDRGSSSDVEIDNCLVFDINDIGTGTIVGIIGNNGTCKIRNCTVTGVANTNGTSGNAQGINYQDVAGSTVQNNLVTNITSTAGTAICYNDSAATTATTATNGSDDATSPQSGLRNLSVTFENAAGSDFRLAAGDDGIDAGTDLGTGSVAIDLLGRNRDTEGDTWDLGGFELQSVINIQLTLVDNLGNPLASLTGIKWAWFDSADPNTFAAPTDKGNAEITDSSGLLDITLNSTTLTTGQTGTLVLFLGTGTDYASFRITL